MDYIYAPWRDEYFNNKVDGCVFCDISHNPKSDQKNLVLYRDEVCFVVMNRYPYTPAHIMVIPHLHISLLEDLSQDAFVHISKIVKYSVSLLKKTVKAQGVNIGMNLGDAAGAGISEHIHYHIVPRYHKDTNFMTSIAKTRVFGSNKEELYEILKKDFNYVNS